MQSWKSVIFLPNLMLYTSVQKLKVNDSDTTCMSKAVWIDETDSDTTSCMSKAVWIHETDSDTTYDVSSAAVWLWQVVGLM